MKKMMSLILVYCLIFSCGGGSQEPLLKDEIENPEPPAATSTPEPTAEEQQKADEPFLSLNKTGTAILAMSVISVIGVLAWKLIFARRKIKDRDRQFGEMTKENEELVRRPTPEAIKGLRSQLEQASSNVGVLRRQLEQKGEELADLRGQLDQLLQQLEQKGNEVAGLHEYAETREKQWEDARTQWQQDLDKMAADLGVLQSDRDQQWAAAGVARNKVKELELSLGGAREAGKYVASERDSAKGALVKEQAMKRILEEANQQLDNSLKTALATLDKLRKEFNEKNKELEAVRHEYDELKETDRVNILRIDKKRDKIKALMKQLAVAEEEIKSLKGEGEPLPEEGGMKPPIVIATPPRAA
jgi:chromosome segregation ATPase